MMADILGIDPETLGEWLLGAAAVVGGAAALLTLAGALREWYRRTLGRRRDRYERLGRLGTQARLSFFESVLGEPAAMRRTVPAEVHEYDPELQTSLPFERALLECFFIDRDYYVQVLCNDEQTVLAFSVTTRSKRFRPRFTFPPNPGLLGRRRWKKATGDRFRPFFDVRLGTTHFDGLDTSRWTPQRRADLGARTYFYTELFYYGNPGYYQHYGFTASVAAIRFRIGPIAEVVSVLGRDWVGGLGDEREDPGQLPEVRRFRHATPITTYTVIGPHFKPEDYPTTFGPHGDEVRTLP